MILVPPDAPITILTSPSLFVMIVGVIEDNERFPGAIALLGEPGSPKLFLKVGDEKSSIPLFNTIPVCFDVKPEPKLLRNNISLDTNAEGK